MMLASANEVSNGVAEHIDGTTENFAKLMTQRAKELGATGTNFTNPHGLHDENHYTTAYDMALIAKELLKFDFFRELMGTTYYVIPPTNKQPEPRPLYAQHKMIKENSAYYFEGCEGGKTGFTNEALNTLVTYAKKGDTELIAVVLKDTGSNIYLDTTALFQYGFANFETVQVFSAQGFTTNVPVTETYKEETLDCGTAVLTAKNDLYATVPVGASTTNIVRSMDCAQTFSAPITQGDELGTIHFSLNGRDLGSVALAASNTVAAIPMEELAKAEQATLFSHIKTAALILLFVIITVTILKEVRYRAKVKRRRRRFQQTYRSRAQNSYRSRTQDTYRSKSHN